MTQDERDNIAIIGLVLAVIALFFEFFRRRESIGEAISSLFGGNPFELPGITVPSLGGDIVIDMPGFIGDPFATPVSKANKDCGCSPYQCPDRKMEVMSFAPIIVSATKAAAPPVFNYAPAAAQSTVCAWNAAGYLSRNPGMQREWIKFSSGTDSAWNKWRKKWKKRGIQTDTREQFLYAHWVQWGQKEGWKYDCP